MNTPGDPHQVDPWATKCGDAPPVDVAPPLAHAKVIGRYRIEKVLGEGGFGRVYLAYDSQLDRPVAIKVPHSERVMRPDDAKGYLAEARLLASLDHPNIVPVYDVGTTSEGLCYVVSKLIVGSDLATRIEHGPLSHNLAAELIATVAEGLHYAHRKGLVHRDIKPGNILLDTSDKAFVADFGLALKEEDFGKGAKFSGTPAYMSPEQARGEGHRVDGRSDIFSTGVVFYELLTARRPFHSNSMDELLDQINTLEARPPRQVDDTIPKELERICLKALSKRASERYLTAKDMADDLRHFLAQTAAGQPIAEQVDGSPCFSGSPTPASHLTAIPLLTPPITPGSPSSNSRQFKIIPKGLRSFDAHDADFFFELLPGPRDRDGLPDSIRFWKTRIEELDPDNTFAVGLIYGPSGCGKSSLVKAGLLPRLGNDVLAVYVEATAAETEARLVNGLRKRCPALPAGLGLKETLATLRRGQGIPAGKKVLIVLDQFEQWLHALASRHPERPELDQTELVQALRQCDGGRVQCVVMVRDDFWMAATRFMRDLEVRLLEGQNSAAVDLFPGRHAEKVLAAFGRAFGVLPDAASSAGKDQKQFLSQAVAGLAQEGKVICVRLALFAEMMKGKAWTPATLREVGGTEGVGVTFLEETFSAASAPPEHRYHQKAARAVLKALLPESGTDIKGHMRASGELLEASGYASRPKDFEDLIRILDSEIRLITPTDPEGKDASEPGGVSPWSLNARYYQLTHDYLVPSLRDWLTRKQKESRRGRAELLLADRAGVWNIRPENRQLPSLWQWFSIRRLTAKKSWTPPQRKMMRKTGRYHAVRGLSLLVIVALVGWGSVEGFGTLKAHALRDRLLNANTTDVPVIVADMASYHRWVDPLLRDTQAEAEAKNDFRSQLHASLALLSVDSGQVDYLSKRLLDAQPQEVSVIRDALFAHKDQLMDKFWAVVEQPAKGKESQRLRAASALASYDPDSPRWDKISGSVVDQLVSENPVYLALWMEGYRPVRIRLLPALVAIFRDRKDERTSERKVAANIILADYAADQPLVLADLLMDADDKQFARIFPILKDHGNRGLALLQSELGKPFPRHGREVLKKAGTIAQDDAKVEISTGMSLPAKVFEMPLKAGKTYIMAMESNVLDSFLVFQDKAGKELAFNDDGGGDLNAVLVYNVAKDGLYKVHAASFKGTGSFLLRVVEAVDENVKEKLAKRQANAAVAMLKMNQPEKVWPLLKHSPDPRVRSYMIHRFGLLSADTEAIVKRLDEEPDVAIRRALILSLGGFSEEKFSLDDRKALLPKLQNMYRTETDPGLHASEEWLLRKWQQEPWLKQTNEAWAHDKEWRKERLALISKELASRVPPAPGGKAQWYVNSQGQTMVVIPGPVEFVMGSALAEADRDGDEQQHKKRIGRTFAVGAKTVTLEQYQQYDKGYTLDKKYTRMADLPVAGTSWYQAAAYCNWLSKQEGIDTDQWCYETDAKEQVTKLKKNYLSMTGYRLPTEAEMEYASRAGALTSRYYGETEELLPNYAWYGYLTNSKEQARPVGSLLPNDLGLFDVQGNVFTWCQESYKAYPKRNEAEASEDQEDDLVVNDTVTRVLRGGSFFDSASSVRSAYRFVLVPTLRVNSVGFRAARTFPLISFTALTPNPQGARR